jgi:3-dehydroquinate dehydratase II
MSARDRIDVMHGVNLDQLGRRPANVYGELTFEQLEFRIDEYADELDLSVRFFQTNAEHEFIEHLHKLEGLADGLILNPGAWTHYAWSIRDALEITGVPAVEVHLSDVTSREPFRRQSVLSDLVIATVSGQGAEGYREALARLKQELGG